MNLATKELEKSPGAKQLAKDYIMHNNVPQLFEALTTGLLHHRPADPVQFVQDAVRVASANRNKPLKWNTFVDWHPPANTDPLSDNRPETSESSTSKVRFELPEHHHGNQEKINKDDKNADSRASSGYRSISRSSEVTSSD